MGAGARGGGGGGGGGGVGAAAAHEQTSTPSSSSKMPCAVFQSWRRRRARSTPRGCIVSNGGGSSFSSFSPFLAAPPARLTWPSFFASASIVSFPFFWIVWISSNVGPMCGKTCSNLTDPCWISSAHRRYSESGVGSARPPLWYCWNLKPSMCGMYFGLKSASSPLCATRDGIASSVSSTKSSTRLGSRSK